MPKLFLTWIFLGGMVILSHAIQATIPPTSLTKAQASADIDQLKTHIRDHFSYLDYRKVDYEKLLDSLKNNLPENGSSEELGLEIQKILSHFQDAHTRVLSTYSMMKKGFLPVRLALYNDRIVCLAKTDQKLFQEDFPYLKSINGVPLSQLLETAGQYEANASKRHMLSGSLVTMGFIHHLLNELGKVNENNLKIEVTNEDNSKSKVIKAKESLSLPRTLEYHYNNGIISQNIGYIGIPVMSNSPRILDSIFPRMNRVKDSDGLVIDLRNNSGGGRSLLQKLYPFFLPPEIDQKVLSLGTFRIDGGDLHPEGYMRERHLHPLSSDVYTSDNLSFLRSFGFNFKPEYVFPDLQFSNLHFTLATHPKGDKRYYHYNKPVVILMNRECLGEAEVFLGAFKGMEDVTLMGSVSSGGGSGNPVTYRLKNSKLRIKISSMISYTPSGQLYLGNGIQPDIILEETLTDVIGSTDGQLNAAIRHLLKQK